MLFKKKVYLKEGETVIDLEGGMLVDENHELRVKNWEEIIKDYHILKAIVRPKKV